MVGSVGGWHIPLKGEMSIVKDHLFVNKNSYKSKNHPHDGGWFFV